MCTKSTRSYKNLYLQCREYYYIIVAQGSSGTLDNNINRNSLRSLFLGKSTIKAKSILLEILYRGGKYSSYSLMLLFYLSMKIFSMQRMWENLIFSRSIAIHKKVLRQLQKRWEGRKLLSFSILCPRKDRCRFIAFALFVNMTELKK